MECDVSKNDDITKISDDENTIMEDEEEPENCLIDQNKSVDICGSLSISDITIETTTESCSACRCVDDEDTFKLACKTCGRRVHYRCTELPPYQIQRFMTKGQQKFICVSCIIVAEYIQDCMLGSNVLSAGRPEDTTVAALRRRIEEQAKTIAQLEECLAQNTTEQDGEAVDNNKTKKRKRDDSSTQQVIDIAVISDSHDKDIKIRMLTEKIAALEKKLAGKEDRETVGNQATKPQ